MKGHRIYPDKDGNLNFKPGDYGKDPRDDNWYARPPGVDNMMGSLKEHDVTEHKDGTITVKPSILVHYEWGDKKWQWHGFLEGGVWREC